MGDFARFVRLVFFSSHNPKRVSEASDIDEAKVEAEEGCSGDQPDDNERKFRTSNGDRIEDSIEDCPRNGTKRLVDGLIDTQWILRFESECLSNLANNNGGSRSGRFFRRLEPQDVGQGGKGQTNRHQGEYKTINPHEPDFVYPFQGPSSQGRPQNDGE